MHTNRRTQEVDSESGEENKRIKRTPTNYEMGQGRGKKKRKGARLAFACV